MLNSFKKYSLIILLGLTSKTMLGMQKLILSANFTVEDVTEKTDKEIAESLTSAIFKNNNYAWMLVNHFDKDFTVKNDVQEKIVTLTKKDMFLPNADLFKLRILIPNTNKDIAENLTKEAQEKNTYEQKEKSQILRNKEFSEENIKSLVRFKTSKPFLWILHMQPMCTITEATIK